MYIDTVINKYFLQFPSNLVNKHYCNDMFVSYHFIHQPKSCINICTSYMSFREGFKKSGWGGYYTCGSLINWFVDFFKRSYKKSNPLQMILNPIVNQRQDNQNHFQTLQNSCKYLFCFFTVAVFVFQCLEGSGGKLQPQSNRILPTPVKKG